MAVRLVTPSVSGWGCLQESEVCWDVALSHEPDTQSHCPRSRIHGLVLAGVDLTTPWHSHCFLYGRVRMLGAARVDWDRAFTGLCGAAPVNMETPPTPPHTVQRLVKYKVWAPHSYNFQQRFVFRTLSHDIEWLRPNVGHSIVVNCKDMFCQSWNIPLRMTICCGNLYQSHKNNDVPYILINTGCLFYIGTIL